MAIFSLLADANNYVADTWDLTHDDTARKYWLDAFQTNLEATLREAHQSLVTDTQALQHAIEQVRRCCTEQLQRLQTEPQQPPLTIFSLDRLRQEILNRYGLRDPYLQVKHIENVKACNHYQRLIKAHEKLDPESLVWVLTEGILAGNAFDLGSTAAARQYQQNGLDFYRLLDNLPKRPWLVDNYESWRDFFIKSTGTIKRVLFFVDNAGPDFVLGCVPLARALAKRGATVTLAANDQACHNDMTVPECRAVLQALAKQDSALGFLVQAKRLRLIGSGNNCPLIDFKQISPACNEAARGTNLLILEGMGRAVESNWNTPFNCTTLKIALLKNEWIAQKLGGKLYDVVCRFEPPHK